CTVEGAVQAATQDGTEILLVGDAARVKAELARLRAASSRIEVVHADETVEMDDSAMTPIRKKRRSSIRICGQLVHEGRAQAMVTAGNTGAAMAVAKMVIGTVPGVDRPALTAVLPNGVGHTVVLDVGANVDSKPSYLLQFGIMGHLYAQEVLGISRPRVGLLSIGEEEGKGTDLTREAFRLLKATNLNFVGNVEGRDVFKGTVDVIVCDGFVGNVMLKSAESLADLVTRMLREELLKTAWSKLGTGLVRPALARVKQRTDYTEYGAAPLLGVNGGCFIGHGRSNAHAVHSAIRRAVEFSPARLDVKIRNMIASLPGPALGLVAEAKGSSAG
ncbi:MAG TPA: phosphate acyltransferase PlsX, partial [Thermoanaerobaculia bacterium]